MRSHGKNHTKDHSVMSAGELAYLGLMLGVSLILSYIEALIPFNFGIPGIKLGLANLCVVILLYTEGPAQAILVNILRIIISGFMFGSMSMIMYSTAGAVLSFACMYLVFRLKIFSPGGVSIIGGIFHNAGQCILACIVVENLRIGIYLPVLIGTGAVTGYIIGIVSDMLIPRLKNIILKSGDDHKCTHI